jgi:transcriptional regulator with XRE-family HTH domain
MDNKEIGAFLKSLRIAKGYTQQEVADKLFLSAKTISKWEVGDGIPDVALLPGIASLYDVTVDEILRGKKDKPAVEPLKENDNKALEVAGHALADALERKFNPFFWSCVGVEAAFLIISLLIFFLSNQKVGQIFGFIGVGIALVVIVAGYRFTMRGFSDENPAVLNLGKKKAMKEIVGQILLFSDVSFVLLVIYTIPSLY